MRIIKETFLKAAGRKHPPAARPLDVWRKVVKAATWRNLMEVRKSYPATDGVKVDSGRRVLVFNIRKKRLSADRGSALQHANRLHAAFYDPRGIQ